MDRLLEKDLAAKILSVVLAVVLWLAVAGEVPETQKTVRGVPVRLHNLDQGLEAGIPVPESVTVIVRGHRRRLSSLGREDFTAWVNLKGARPGRLSYAIDSVGMPKGVTLVENSPEDVLVLVEAVVEREAPVRVAVQGSPAEGYRAGVPAAVPGRVVLRGTEAELARVTAVEAAIEITGASQDVESSRPLLALDKDGRPLEKVRVEPDRARVAVPILEPTAARQVAVRPVVAGEPAKGYAVLQVEVTPAIVTVVGPRKVVDRLQEVSLEAVKVDGARADVTADVAVVVPPGVDSVGQSRARVVVSIGRQR